MKLLLCVSPWETRGTSESGSEGEEMAGWAPAIAPPAPHEAFVCACRLTPHDLRDRRPLRSRRPASAGREGHALVVLRPGSHVAALHRAAQPAALAHEQAPHRGPNQIP